MDARYRKWQRQKPGLNIITAIANSEQTSLVKTVRVWLGAHMVVVITRKDLSQGTFPIEMFR